MAQDNIKILELTTINPRLLVAGDDCKSPNGMFAFGFKKNPGGEGLPRIFTGRHGTKSEHYSTVVKVYECRGDYWQNSVKDSIDKQVEQGEDVDVLWFGIALMLDAAKRFPVGTLLRYHGGDRWYVVRGTEPWIEYHRNISVAPDDYEAQLMEALS